MTDLNLYHRNGGKWVQFDTIDRVGSRQPKCSISGNTLMVQAFYGIGGAASQILKLFRYADGVVSSIQDNIKIRTSHIETTLLELT